MQAAREQTEARDNQLGVLIGQRRWLLNLQETGEVVPVTATTKVPLTQDWYLGLVNIRGNLISVIDFARYLGLAQTDIEPASRIVTFAPALGVNCGLLVFTRTGFAQRRRNAKTARRARCLERMDWRTLPR